MARRYYKKRYNNYRPKRRSARRSSNPLIMVLSPFSSILSKLGLRSASLRWLAIGVGTAGIFEGLFPTVVDKIQKPFAMAWNAVSPYFKSLGVVSDSQADAVSEEIDEEEEGFFSSLFG